MDSFVWNEHHVYWKSENFAWVSSHCPMTDQIRRFQVRICIQLFPIIGAYLP